MQDIQGQPGSRWRICSEKGCPLGGFEFDRDDVGAFALLQCACELVAGRERPAKYVPSLERYQDLNDPYGLNAPNSPATAESSVDEVIDGRNAPNSPAPAESPANEASPVNEEGEEAPLLGTPAGDAREEGI